MQDAELHERIWPSLRCEIELFGTLAPDAQLFEHEGFLASCVPATPDRSLFNSVVCTTQSALAACYDELLRKYADHGVRAFTVWTTADDTASARLLGARGHVIDSRPVAMGADLSALTLPAPIDLDVIETRDLSLVARMNNAAYGLSSPAFDAALAGDLPPNHRAYVARQAGEAVCALLTYDVPHADLGITAVATLPHARRQGLASRLLAHVLEDARTRGLRTTSLQASPQGSGVYARLGYRALDKLLMWERRVPPGERLSG